MLRFNHSGFFFFFFVVVNFYFLKDRISLYPRLAYYVYSSGFFFLCQMSDVSNFITRFEGGTCHIIMWILNHHAYESKKDPASSTLISYFIISNICESAKKSNEMNLFLFTQICTKEKNKATDKLCWTFVSSATIGDDLSQQGIAMVFVMTVSVSLI